MRKDKDQIFISESAKTTEVVEKVKSYSDFLEKSMANINESITLRLKEMREDSEVNVRDMNQYLTDLANEYGSFNVKEKFLMLKEFDYLKKEPFFARIDLKNEEEQNQIYIGKFGFIDDQGPIVTDWRAKIASVFYRFRYPQKNVTYDTPDGVVTKDLTLKRTFEIQDGQLIKYFNNDLGLDENEIISEKIKERTGGVLEDIIETIQQSQLDIIEADPRQICIVQGCVGSGKSTVAIHKLSYIFFNYPEIIRPERSILIAKNQILVGYLSTLFPKLGIFDLGFGTVKDMIVRVLFREGIKIFVELSDQNFDKKIDIEFVNRLKSVISRVHLKYKEEIENVLNLEEFSNYSSYVYDPRISVVENIDEAILDLQEEIQIQKNISENGEYPLLSREKAKENIKNIKKIVSMLLKVASRAKYDFDLLINDFDLKSTQTKKLNYYQTLIYLYFYSEIIGFSKFQKFEYCVVDEGQDFTLLDYLFLGKIIINGRFCILGDLNQSYAKDGLLEWDLISNVIESAKSAATFTLETNYRSTKPIIDFANSILSPYTNLHLPKSIDRIGPNPIVKTASDDADLITQFGDDLEKDLVALNKSIGIILMDISKFDEVEKRVSNLAAKQDKNYLEDKIVRLDSSKRISYIPNGIYLTSFEDCKGLEFNKVYILDLNLENIVDFTQAKRAFVAVTRAMNEVHIYFKKQS